MTHENNNTHACKFREDVVHASLHPQPRRFHANSVQATDKEDDEEDDEHNKKSEKETDGKGRLNISRRLDSICSCPKLQGGDVI